MDVETYRKNDIQKIISKFESDVDKYYKFMEEKKKLGKLYMKLDLIITVVGIVITLIFSLLGTNEVINPKISIVVMESLFTAGASLLLLVSRLGKLQNKKYYIYEKIKNYSLESFNNFKLLYSNIFEDNVIDKEEYEKVIAFKNDYETNKTTLKAELGNGYKKIESN